MTDTANNPLGLEGIEFTEFSSHDPESLHELFLAFGFSRIMRHKEKSIDLYRQGEITFFLNSEPQTFGHKFYEAHGPCVSAMGWRFTDAKAALEGGVENGAEMATELGDYTRDGNEILAIKGIGDSLIYFVDNYQNTEALYKELGFVPHPEPVQTESLGFQFMDHLTNNVFEGTMKTWSDFYKNVFGFTEVRYFDIRGVKTGLTSYALRSPDGSFCIPINEGSEKKSQINEYLDEYKGAGVQHIALHTNDIIDTVSKLVAKGQVETLDIDDQYYQEVFERVPNVTEDHKKLQDLQILVDGNEEGYLLQIFTKNVIGPIFFEIIQRKNELGFGEGNFGALFRSIERDQQKRGYLD